MNKKNSGQITLEVAIAFPIIMIIVVSLIYLTFYIHDIVTAESHLYEVGVENSGESFENFESALANKAKKLPTFLLEVKTECSEKGGYYSVDIVMSDGGAVWPGRFLLDTDRTRNIQIEKKMSGKTLYEIRAACDQFE